MANLSNPMLTLTRICYAHHLQQAVQRHLAAVFQRVQIERPMKLKMIRANQSDDQGENRWLTTTATRTAPSLVGRASTRATRDRRANWTLRVTLL